MFYLKSYPKFFYTQKNIFLWKSVLLFWIDFTSALLILLKSKVTHKNINYKNIYCEDYFDQLVDSLYKIQNIQQTGFNPQHHAVPSEKFKKTKYLKLMIKQVKLQWHKSLKETRRMVIACYSYACVAKTKLDK